MKEGLKMSPLRKQKTLDYDSETVHDFLNDKIVVHSVAGQGNSRSFLYYSYVGLVVGVHLYLMVAAMITICVASTSKKVTIDACHIFLLVSFSMHGLVTRHAIDGTLRKTIRILKCGVYNYDKEEPIEEHVNIKRLHVATIRRTTKSFNVLIYIAAVLNAVVIPVLQAVLFEGEDSRTELNPYLPKPFYMPFNTRTYLGFTVGYLFNLAFFLYLILSVACMNEIYLSCTLQLKAQLKILNHSLSHIDDRAYKMYIKINRKSMNYIPGDLFDNEIYQNCLYECLRANAQHHQAIITLRKTFHQYTGACVLDNIAIASLILACNLFLVLEVPGYYEVIISSFTLIAEMLYTFQCCYSGELVLQESEELFFSLYGTPWFQCNARFNRVLCIIMSNMRTPIRITAIALDFAASLETYGHIISGMYKFMNFARHDSGSSA